LVAWESVRALLNPAPLQNPSIAIWVLAASLLATTALVGLQSLAIRRTGSLIVKGDRAHYVGDILANSGALAAVVIGEVYGILRADAIAGFIAAIFLGLAGYQVARAAIPQLMDEELPHEDQETIRRILDKDPDVISFHALRTRRAGGQRFIQLDIQIDAGLSFRRAHAITDRVELALEEAFGDADVIVHPDPIGEARLERRVLDERSARLSEAAGLERVKGIEPSS
ncbi:MAG: cation diffusion facilitator family transporter, partial [Pseudomonadota bacterium]